MTDIYEIIIEARQPGRQYVGTPYQKFRGMVVFEDGILFQCEVDAALIGENKAKELCKFVTQIAMEDMK